MNQVVREAPIPARATLAERMAEKPDWSQSARQLWIGFWWWILMPIDCVDLKTGLPRHERMASMGFLVIFAIKTVTEPGWPPTVQVAAWFAAIFGESMFTKFLVRSQLGATDTTNVNVSSTLLHTITEERKAGDGTFQPTP